MFYSSLYFFPAVVALVWFILYLCRRKNTSQRILTVLLLFEIFHCASQAFYVSPDSNYISMCNWDVISQPLILITVALANIYIYSLLDGKPMSAWYTQLFLLPAFAQAVAVWLLYYLIGVSNVARFYEAIDSALLITNTRAGLFNVIPEEFDTPLYRLFGLFDGWIFDFWCLLLGICLIIMCFRVSKKYDYHFGDVYRFWFRGGATTPQRATSFCMVFIIIIYLLRVLVGRTYLFVNPGLGLMMLLFISVGIFCLSYCEYFSHLTDFTLYGITHADLLIVKEIESASVDSEKKSEPEDNDELPDEDLEDEIEFPTGDLAENLKYQLEVRKVFRDSRLTLEVLAKRFGTNRTKLSIAVNQVYGMDFRNAVARLRIAEAKRFMLKNPEATAEVVAAHCGFKDSSAFFHRFKDFTGESPRMWMIRRQTQTK